MLRVDTFTASESRGRFARLCIQIDVEKPLVTAILIGKHEQSVSCEGIQTFVLSVGDWGIGVKLARMLSGKTCR